MASGSSLTWPLRRVLDPRFADVTHRVAGVAEELHVVRDQTTDLQAHVGALRGEVGVHAEALLEVAVHLGERMDRIEAALARIEQKLP